MIIYFIIYIVSKSKKGIIIYSDCILGEDIFDEVPEDNFVEVPFYADDKMCIADNGKFSILTYHM